MKPNHPAEHRRSRSRSFPTVEPLESRIAPAATVSANAGTLLVQDAGTIGDHITFSVNGPNYHIVDPGGLSAGIGANQINGTTVEVPISSINGPINIFLGSGNDTVSLTGTISTLGGLTIDTGAGNDVVTLGGPLTTGGNVSLTSAGGTINFAGTLGLATGKTLNASAGTISVGSGASITTQSADIVLATDVLSISGTLNSSAANAVVIQPFTSNVGMDLGSGNDPVGGPLSLSDAELDQISGGFLHLGGPTTGAINITAGITLSPIGNITVTSGPGAGIRFTGTGQLDVGTNALSLVSGSSIDSGAVAVEVTAGTLSLATLGGGDIGNSSNPLGFSAQSLNAMTNGAAASLYLDSTTTTSFTSLDAGGGTIFLRHGTFVAASAVGALNGGSNLALDGTLDLAGYSVAVSNLTGSTTGLVTNSAPSPAGFSFGGGLGATATFAGVIADGTGPVGITKTGTGTEALTGANTYIGPTAINVGTLQIGAGGTTGSIAGTTVTIGSGATFAVNHSDTVSFPNTFSGSGTFQQIGSGTTVLTGSNALTGTVIISAGALQVGGGAPGGTLGTASVIDNGTLAFNQSGIIAFSNPISGTGGLHQFGIGTVSLSGNNSYTGNSVIDAGSTLEFDTVCAALDSSLTLNGGTVAYNLGGTHTAGPAVSLGANSTVSVAGGSRVDWSGNSITGGSFSLTKSGAGALSHDDAVWDTKQIFIQNGALISLNPGALGTSPIDVTSGAALWIDGSYTFPNVITLRGDGDNVSVPSVAPSGALVHTGAGGVATLTGSINLATTSEINTTGGDVVLNGLVVGLGGLTKSGANKLTLANKKNSFGLSGGTSVSVTGGTLQVGSDHALGDAGNSLLFSGGGGLTTTAGFISLRHVTAVNDTTFDVTGTVQLLGTVDGTGVITKAGTGKLVFGTGYTGSTTVSTGTGPVAIGASKFSVTGDGSAVITIVPDGLGGQKVQSIALSDTTNLTKVVVKGPSTPGGTLVVENITSADPADEILSITLRKGVIFGDGVADAVPDLNLAGKVTKLSLDTISTNTLIRLGTGLTYNNTGDDTSPDTYNNHPDFIARNVGDGVIIDVTGDGLPAGTGGGGLGRVNITNWPGDGVIRTTQSITSFTLRNGDCNVVFEVDKNHTGAATVADVGHMVITHGAWGSSGSEVEGAIGSFSGQAFIMGATLTAGNILKFAVKNGPFAGTLTLTKPDDARLGTFTVNGDYTGTVDAAEAIKNVNVKGDFHGSLSAKAIGSITAYTFDGTAVGDTFGDATKLNIIAREGSLGTLKAKVGLIKNFDISVATVFSGISVPKVTGVPPVETGVKNVTVNAAVITGITSAYDISDSIFASAGTIAKVLVGAALLNANVSNTKILAGANLGDDLAIGGAGDAADVFSSAAITNFKIYGNMSAGSFVGAGVDPGDGIFGNGGDTVIGGVASKAPTIAVTGTVSVDSHFTAGMFKKPKIANVVINPLADARFTVG